MRNATLTAKRTLTLLATTALLICIGISSEAYASNHNEKAHPMREVMQQLNLTDTQRQQIRDVMMQHKQKKPNREERNQMQSQMVTIVSAPEFNQKAASDLADKMTAKVKQHMLQRLETQHAIYQILDEQQRSQYMELLEKRRSKMESRGQGRDK